jgi:mono/diheme cytochrome c family protein
MIALLMLLAVASHSFANEESAQRLYRQAILPSGAMVRGDRGANGAVEGFDAACVNCHRRSGFGTTEGKFIVPPIAGKYLFRPHGGRPEDIDFRYRPGFVPKREPYTDATLARAIRDGVGRDGTPLNMLMPHFALDDAAMADLIAYLKKLSSDPTPGVSDDTLNFATIITPDADPVKRQGMLDVLNRFFRDKNEFIRGGLQPMRSDKGVMYRVIRKWQLHVWELSGPADTWEQQLHALSAAEPVFAIVSGLGGTDWAPIHRFCEQESIPCLLPNVELPVDAENDFYSIYFSREVLLEAQLIAHRLGDEQMAVGRKRAVQIFRQGDIGQQAAGALAAALKMMGWTSESRILGAPASTLPATRELARAVDSVEAGDALILWLRPPDLALLPARAAKSRTVFVSGLMAQLEHAPLPSSWREAVRMTYPFDLPELRKVRMNFPLGWFKVRNIAVVNERVQSDTYLACRILSESLGDMLDSFVREYLVEQVEGMLSRRLVNGYYPRLGLAPGQRFASKGGYIVRFAQPDLMQPAIEGAWIAP